MIIAKIKSIRNLIPDDVAVVKDQYIFNDSNMNTNQKLIDSLMNEVNISKI